MGKRRRPLTAIVGVGVPGKGVVLGGDSAAVQDRHRVNVSPVPKLYQLHADVAIGYTYSYRFGQIVGHHLKIDNGIPLEWDPYNWAIEEFVPALRTALKDHGAMGKSEEREEGGTLLLAVRDRLFSVESDFCVIEFQDNVAACGSGLDGATPVMRYIRRTAPETSSREIAQLGLEAAQDYNCFVRPPWHFKETKV